jgi:hypothetical protein
MIEQTDVDEMVRAIEAAMDDPAPLTTEEQAMADEMVRTIEGGMTTEQARAVLAALG